MTPQFADQVVPVFLKAMRERLQEALACAKAAEAYLQDGDRDGALKIALDVEVLTAEADALLNAAAIVQRRARKE